MATTDQDHAFKVRGWSYAGLLIGIAVALGIWLLSTSGALRPAAGILYDPVLRYKSRLTRGDSPVFLVAVDPDAATPDEAAWLKTLEALQKLGARRVVFNFLPAQVTPAFYEKAAGRGNVLFGRGMVPDPDDPDAVQPAPLPPPVAGREIPTGVVGVPPATRGVSRSQHASYRIADRAYPALEAAAAESDFAAPVALGGRDYLVNFRGGPGSLPNVPLGKVLSGNYLTARMVEGKTVLIGAGARGADPGVHTPTTADDRPMSLLEFQGQALDTLLTGRRIREAGPGATLLILLLVAAVSVLAYQRMDVRWASWFTAGVLVLYAGTTAVLFVSSNIWPPVTEAALAQVLLFILILRNKAVHAHLALSKLMLDLSSKLRERFWPASFYSSPEHWSQVITMVDQTLDLKRTIFLERVVKDHRVREIKSLNCSLQDIGEMRRDYERTPYSTAIEARGPIRLEKVYLKKLEDGGPEDQWLIPLIFGGEVLGFWAFGVDPAHAAAIHGFEAVVADFGEQISELLYHRQRVLKEQAGEHALKRYLTSERQAELHQALGKTMGLMERRLTRMESLLDEMQTATIVYDLFGRTLKVNRRMQELLKREGFPP